MSLFSSLNKQTKKKIHTKSNPLSIPYFSKLPNFTQTYLLNRNTLGYSQQTLQKYSYDYYIFFSFLIEKSGAEIEIANIQLNDMAGIELGAVEMFMEYLTTERKNGVHAVQRKMGSLSSLFKFYLDKGELKTNPFSQVERVKAKKRETIFLKEQELYDLLSEIEETRVETDYEEEVLKRDIAFISLLAFSGCRISEICALRIKDIMSSRQEIQVIGKGNKQRTVPVPEKVFDYLHDYLQVVKFTPKQPADYLFFGLRSKEKFHKPLSTRSGEKIIKKYVEMLADTFLFLQNKKITPHKLRHTYATVLLENNVDVFTIQKLLGHESVATTQLYAHVLDGKKRKAADIFDK